MKTNTEVYYIIMNMNVKSMEVEITDEKNKDRTAWSRKYRNGYL